MSDKVQRYTVTVRPVLTERQRAWRDAEGRARSAGDSRDWAAVDDADAALDAAGAALAAHGEEPGDDRPITSPPPWTEAMGRACFQRILDAGEHRTPGWDGWREMRETLAGSERWCCLYSVRSVTRWALENLECIPHEVVPYLPCMVEHESIAGRSVQNAEHMARMGIKQ